jgi:poly(3-hydroxyalkanoate) synthetase
MHELSIFLIHGCLGGILWLKMMAILDKKGIKNPGIIVKPSDFILFYAIVSNEKDSQLKSVYQAIFWGQIVVMCSFIFSL